jgi:hypothetical protein
MQGLVQPSVVVKAEPLADGAARLESIGIGLQVHLFVLQAASQPLDEDVVQPAPAAVHADLHAVASSLSVKAAPVNCAPWSALKISSRPFLRASSRVSRHHEVSIVFDRR